MDILLRIVLYVLVGLSIGAVSGAIGIGGGVLLIPMLMWLFDFKFGKAVGTTLAVLVPPIGLPAAWKYYEENNVDLRAAIWIAVSLALGAYLGASLRRHVSDEVLQRVFGLLMLYIGMRCLLGSQSEVAIAGAAVASMALAWLVYLGLRTIGRRHIAPPSLLQKIQRAEQKGYGETDYHI